MTATDIPTSVTPAAEDLPKIISVDDHILEPRTLWQEQLPPSLRDRGPRVVREKVSLEFKGGHYGFTRGAEDGKLCDLWLFDDLVVPTGLLHAAVGYPDEEQINIPAIYEDFRPGTYDKTARLEDMTANHVEAAINYPNVFPRFAGQGFAERDDKDFALLCLQIYNDWMIDEWSGADANGRLIPLTLVPLWDPVLAAAEVRRCAAKGSYAIAFSENPSKLGFASMHSGEWDVLWDACQESDTTVSMHIGSSSTMPTTSPDAPLGVSMALSSQNAQGSLTDWIFSGTLSRFPTLKIAFAESQIGWMPYLIERMDIVATEGAAAGVQLDRMPSEIVKGRCGAACSTTSTASRAATPSASSTSSSRPTTPHRRHVASLASVAHRLCAGAGMNEQECYEFLRGNAIRCYGLERFGISV